MKRVRFWLRGNRVGVIGIGTTTVIPTDPDECVRINIESLSEIRVDTWPQDVTDPKTVAFLIEDASMLFRDEMGLYTLAVPEELEELGTAASSDQIGLLGDCNA